MMSIPLWFYQSVNLTNAILSLILGIAVLFSRVRSRQILLFSLFAFSVFLWDFFYFLAFQTNNYALSSFLFRTCMIAGALILPIFTEFVYALVGKEIKPVYRLLNFGITAVIISTIYTSLYASDGPAFMGFSYWPIVGVTSFIQMMLYGINIYFSHGELIRACAADDPHLRQQARIIVVGTSLGYLGAASNFILWFRIPFPPILNILIPIYIISVAYAITKHELMDIKVVITRAVAYGIVGATLIASFVALNLIGLPFIISIGANAALGLLWALVAHRVREFIQTPLVEKWITDWYNSDKLINQIAIKLIPVIEKEAAFKIIADELQTVIKIKNIEVKVGKQDADYADITQSRAGLIIPLSSSEGLEGILILGQKISEDPYNEKDLIIFRTIMVQAMAILDRIRPYEQIKKDFDANEKKLYDTERLLARSEKIASMASLIQEYNHEIRTPLSIMSAEIGALTDNPNEIPDFKAFKDDLLKQIYRAADIVNSTLRLSQPKAREEKPLDINNVITAALDLYKPLGINLIKELSPVPNINGDYEDLKIVFINILKNASEAIKENGEIKIKTYVISEEGEQIICIEVSDNGAGIPEENMEKIFEPFFSTHVTKGRGLGLSIVFRIIREHLGKIDVRSKVGEGTTFIVKLPVKP